jgi:hypothetical protein
MLKYIYDMMQINRNDIKIVVNDLSRRIALCVSDAMQWLLLTVTNHNLLRLTLFILNLHIFIIKIFIHLTEL